MRAAVLAEEPLCQAHLAKGKRVPATEVDHKDGNSHNNDRANLQGLCKSCHAKKTATEHPHTRRAQLLPTWMPMPIKPLIVVCGPPGSGKTTHVRERAQPGDLVLDLDELAERNGLDTETPQGRDKAIRIRNSILAKFCEGRTKHPRCWLIATAGSFKQRKFWKDLGAEVVPMMTDKAICRQRVMSDGRPNREGRLAAIDRWA